MGGSILSCWLDQKILDPRRSAVVDPSPRDSVVREIDAYGLPLNPEEDQPYDVCVLAVKPQLLPSIIPALQWPNMQKTIFLSVAAGKSVGSIRNHLKEAGAGDAPIIRAMPNLPVAVKHGVTLLYAESRVQPREREIATRLMSATGSVLWVDKEEQIDSGMSISSCGPAYVFLLTEAMAEAGEAAGLPADIAEKLARETVTGAGALMAHDRRSAKQLRQAVTSKGGTTAEALKVLDDPKALRPLVTEAVAAATKRARELSD